MNMRLHTLSLQSIKKKRANDQQQQRKKKQGKIGESQLLVAIWYGRFSACSTDTWDRIPTIFIYTLHTLTLTFIYNVDPLLLYSYVKFKLFWILPFVTLPLLTCWLVSTLFFRWLLSIWQHWCDKDKYLYRHTARKSVRNYV